MFSWKSLILHHQQLFVLMLQREQDLPPNQHPQRHWGPSGATLLPGTNLPALPAILSLKIPPILSATSLSAPCPSNPALGKERGTDSSVCISI